MDPKTNALKILSNLNALSQRGVITKEEKEEMIVCLKKYMKTGGQNDLWDLMFFELDDSRHSR